MSIITLDHVTIRTTKLLETLEFYERFFGLTPGFRPPFSTGGAWLYAEGGSYPILHVIETDVLQPGMRDHFAFRVQGLSRYLDRVKAAGAAYMAITVPETDLVQVQHRDPNGLLVEATFENEIIQPEEVRDSIVP